MDVASFDHILNLIAPEITKQDTQFREAIEPGLKLALNLHHLAEGATHKSIAAHYRLGHSTVSQAIYNTCSAIYKVLQPIYMSTPDNPDQWKEIAERFYQNWDFPNCMVCIDGKHFLLPKPSNAGSDYYNYKGTHSIVLMGICDASYRFTMIDVGQKGSCNDAGIWELSPFNIGLEEGAVNLSEPCYLPADTSGIKFPYMLLGDEAFPLRTYLMRPYPGKGLDEIYKRIFNYRLCRARRVIENSFGILTQRWRLLMRPIAANREKAACLVKAMCVLHHYLCTTRDALHIPTGYADCTASNGHVRDGFWRKEAMPPLNNIQTISRSVPAAAIEVRERLTQYFSADGSLNWHLDFVNTR